MPEQVEQKRTKKELQVEDRFKEMFAKFEEECTELGIKLGMIVFIHKPRKTKAAMTVMAVNPFIESDHETAISFLDHVEGIIQSARKRHRQ